MPDPRDAEIRRQEAENAKIQKQLEKAAAADAKAAEAIQRALDRAAGK